MSTRLLAGLAAAMTLFPALAFCDPDAPPVAGPSTDAQPAEAPASDNANSAPEANRVAGVDIRGHHRLLTPLQQGHQGLIKGVVEAPLRDLNLMQGKIPPVLKLAMINAYARPQPDDCEGITTQVNMLSDALGPDYDEPVAEHRGLRSKAKNGVLDAMREGEKAYIPYDGAIRFVSGASRHDQYVLAAIQAGAARRAYLKGLGEDHGCALPGSPSHLASGTVRKEPGFGDWPSAGRGSDARRANAPAEQR